MHLPKDKDKSNLHNWKKFSTPESKKYLYFQDTTSKEKAQEAKRYH
jgi:hypothetical protein